TMQIVKCSGVWFTIAKQRNFTGHETGTVNCSLRIAKDLPDPATFINPARQSIVRTAEQRTTVFNRAKQSGRSVLPLRCALAEPAIVRQVHQEISVRFNIFPCKMRKRVLVTDQHRSFCPQRLEFERNRPFAPREPALDRCEPLEQRQNMFKR